MNSIDLTGKWRFRKFGTKKWYEATVPGCVHIDLYRNNLIPDPFKGSNELELQWIEKTDFEYLKEFDLEEEFLRFRIIELVTDGLDTLATIRINEKEVASTKNMFIGYRFNVKKFLVVGKNTISIMFKNPMEYIKNYPGFKFFDQPNDPVGGSSVIRKMQCSFGWDWGPRMPTCGIYRSIKIEGRNFNKINHVYIKQIHLTNKVKLVCYPQTCRPISKDYYFRYSLSYAGTLIDSSLKNELIIDNPKLWWPNGYGEQPLYDIRVELFYKDIPVDIWYRQIGLRTISLCRKEDRWGESFMFVVNGKKIYAKGASWIPANIFPSEVTEETYKDLLLSAVNANFNMIRVWGGGLYEQDIFYDLCDRYGLMVWHDFMFSCSLYPFDKDFFSLVAKETIYQTKRLAHHPCMALWCGNNEIEAIFKINEMSEEIKKGYRYLFYNLLPQIVEKNSPHISYIPTSPYKPLKYENPEKGGDHHFWEVWHGKLPPESVWKYKYRFWSEFGMQSYCHVDTALNFIEEKELNIFGPSFENHQKHPLGNLLIFQYLAYRYRFPKDFDSVIYLSQVNQIYCVSLMVEHQRALMPYCMGSLYWQLNDCWPAISWSSIDFGGKWKGLHYAAKKFYSPILVTYRLIGEEYITKINRRINNISGIEIITVYEGETIIEALLSWDVYTISKGTIEFHGEKNITLTPNEAVVWKELDMKNIFNSYPKNSIVLRLLLKKDSEILAEKSVFFTAPKYIDFPKEKIAPIIKEVDFNTFELIFETKTFQHMVFLDIPNKKFSLSDNFFDMYPQEKYNVTLKFDTIEKIDKNWLVNNLKIISIADSY